MKAQGWAPNLESCHPSLCTALPEYQDPEILGVCIAEIIHCALPAPDHRGFFKKAPRGAARRQAWARGAFLKWAFQTAL